MSHGSETMSCDIALASWHINIHHWPSSLDWNQTSLNCAQLNYEPFVSNTFSEFRGWELHFHPLGIRLLLLNHRVKVELDQPLKYASHSSCPTSFISWAMQTHSLPLWLPFFKWPHLNQISQSQTFLQS